MNYIFNVENAIKYGVDEAIVLENLIFWIRKNKVNGEHFHEEHYWTYNSVKAFKELFPFWSEKQIRRVLLSLEKQGAIITGNFNKLPYDQTKWYAIANETLLNLPDKEVPISQIGEPKWEGDNFPNGKGTISQMGKPIPDNKPDNKTNINIYSSTALNIISYLNEKTNSKYRTTPKTTSLITARLREGFEEKDFYKVIDIKVAEWKDTDMAQYLRPITLFGTKFESYLNQKEKTQQPEYVHRNSPLMEFDD